MTDDWAWLDAIDRTLDDAMLEYRLALPRLDPETRALFKRLHRSGETFALLDGSWGYAPFHMPPPPPGPRPVMTTVLVMDRQTERRLWATCRRVAGASYAPRPMTGPVMMYDDVDIKLDEDADGRIYVVSLRQMQEATQP